MLKAQPKFAIVCARGLGDALLSMILAHNLKLAGIPSTIFSNILCELKDWFPGYRISPYPSPDHFVATLSNFETLIAADHSLINESHQFGNRLILLKEDKFNKKQSMVSNLKAVCAEELSLPAPVFENGIVPPSGMVWRRYPKRVLIHPMSADEKKNWPAEKFIKLAHQLLKEGYDPYFCMCPTEGILWKGKIDKSRIPHFQTVGELASFVYQSGYLIGNDSGVGHLASALKIPTLTLFARKSYSHLWRPSWGPGTITSPPNILPGARLKQKFWKNLLTVRNVRKSFFKLVKKYTRLNSR